MYAKAATESSRATIAVTPSGVEGGSERCVVAQRPIADGELVMLLDGEIGSSRHRHTLQVGLHSHLAAPENTSDTASVVAYPWRFVNHSCAPNTRVHDGALIACRDIEYGEEVTFDYNATEWELAEPFPCRCGASNCCGKVRGFQHLSDSERIARRSFLAPYLRDALL